MGKAKKVWLLVGTLWPFLYIILFFLFAFSLLFLLIPQGGETPPPSPAWIAVIFPFHFLTIFLIWGLMIFYIIHVVKNRSLSKDQRILWIILLVFLNILGMLIYFFLYIWKEGKEEKT
jgi:hypothetical protein